MSIAPQTTADSPATPRDRYARVGLADIYDKVQAGERLSGADGLRLYENPDLQAVGALANIVRERKNGNFAYFNRNLRIDYTNVCNKQCLFCAFDRLPGEPGGYVLQRDDIHARLRQYDDVKVTEVHIIGGIHPRLPFSYYIDLLGWVREARPDIHIKAFTMVEIAQMIKISGLGPEGTIRALMDAGLQSCPGGGAEVLSERVHRELFRIKIGPPQWIELQKLVHQCGLRSTATMLYGHIETAAERIEHMEKLRALQDETGGFQTFIPLAFHPANTELSHLPAPSAFDDLRNIAVGRLMLDNFDHVKAYWIMMSAPISQIALAYGADDVDGTTLEETVFHEAGAVTPTGMSVEAIVRMLREAGRIPVERDTLYRHLRVYDSAA